MTSAGGVGVTQGLAVGVSVGVTVGVNVGRFNMMAGVSGAQAASNSRSRKGKYFFIHHIIHTPRNVEPVRHVYIYSIDKKEKAMTIDTNSTRDEHRERKVVYKTATSAPVYGLGLIGALVYYISHAATFWMGVLGVFKAIFWPAMLVYELLKYLEM